MNRIKRSSNNSTKDYHTHITLIRRHSTFLKQDPLGSRFFPFCRKISAVMRI